MCACVCTHVCACVCACACVRACACVCARVSKWKPHSQTLPVGQVSGSPVSLCGSMEVCHPGPPSGGNLCLGEPLAISLQLQHPREPRPHTAWASRTMVGPGWARGEEQGEGGRGRGQFCPRRTRLCCGTPVGRWRLYLRLPAWGLSCPMPGPPFIFHRHPPINLLCS